MLLLAIYIYMLYEEVNGRTPIGKSDDDPTTQ